MEYVIKEWFVDETPNSEGVYVKIKGREGGIISFLLSWVGIDPTVMMIVDTGSIRFEKGSWSEWYLLNIQLFDANDETGWIDA